MGPTGREGGVYVQEDRFEEKPDAIKVWRDKTHTSDYFKYIKIIVLPVPMVLTMSKSSNL